MAAINWVSSPDPIGPRGLHEATIDNTGVTLVVRWCNDTLYTGWASEVRVGSPTQPGTGEAVTLSYRNGTLAEAKLDALKLFKEWATTVLLLAQSDGWGNHIDVSTGDKIEAPIVSYS